MIFLIFALCSFPVDASETLGVGEAAEYVVRAGDTLEGIARQYGVDVNQLAELNNIADRSLINTGRTLKIPGKEPSAENTVTESSELSMDSSLI
ncbi:MAG: LysM peptidoglycan-binding domain-containing protein, partial [Gracilibacteraceae bacterium]|nr:LysM peptidoglycan-binding domain-containing protein [Gracilibacteraceae bacterium]